MQREFPLLPCPPHSPTLSCSSWKARHRVQSWRWRLRPQDKALNRITQQISKDGTKTNSKLLPSEDVAPGTGTSHLGTLSYLGLLHPNYSYYSRFTGRETDAQTLTHRGSQVKVLAQEPAGVISTTTLNHGTALPPGYFLLEPHSLSSDLLSSLRCRHVAPALLISTLREAEFSNKLMKPTDSLCRRRMHRNVSKHRT